MFIFDDNNRPIIIDNIFSPIVTEYFWVLDFDTMDFKLTPCKNFRQTICPGFKVSIKGTEIILPTNWYVLIFDNDTSQLDVVQIKDVAGQEFTAFVYGPTASMHSRGTITVLDYYMEYKHVGPLLNKNQMLCHPINEKEWINVSPSDSYSKYLKDKIIGDILGY